MPKRYRGLSSISHFRQLEIARKGGKAAHQEREGKKKGHEWTGGPHGTAGKAGSKAARNRPNRQIGFSKRQTVDEINAMAEGII